MAARGTVRLSERSPRYPTRLGGRWPTIRRAADSRDGEDDDEVAERDTLPSRVPLGAWWRLYLLCAVAAVAVLALLWWFSHSFNVRLGAP